MTTQCQSSFPTTSDDRDVVDNILRSCGLERRQTDRQRWILHRCKFSRTDHVTEATFGRTIRRRVNTAVPTLQDNSSRSASSSSSDYWIFSDHKQIGKLTKLKKLHLSQYQAMHSLSTLNRVADELSDLECLILDQCQFSNNAEENEDRNTPDEEQASVVTTTNIFPKLTKLVVMKPAGLLRLQQQQQQQQPQQQDPGVEEVQSMRTFMEFVVNTMPYLQELHFSFLPYHNNNNNTSDHPAAATDVKGEERRSNNLLDTILDVMVCGAQSEVFDDASFSNNLKVFTFNHSGMTDEGFRRLLVEVLPVYPNIQSISVQNNRISSLLGLLTNDDGHLLVVTKNGGGGNRSSSNDDENSSNNNHIPPQPYSASLRTLNLQHNPVMKKLHSGDKYRQEVDTLKHILQYWIPFCGSLSAPWEDWEACVEHELRINRSGGRVLSRRRRRHIIVPKDVFGGADDCKNTTTKTSTTVNVALTPSLFPLILHRAYCHPSTSQGFLPAVNHPNQATGIAFLIRSFPEFLQRQDQHLHLYQRSDEKHDDEEEHG
jgi:hypothetical protein